MLEEVINVVFTKKSSPNVYNYLDKIGVTEEDYAYKEIRKLVDIGVTVIESMQVSKDVQFVKKEMDSMIVGYSHSVEGLFSQLNDKVGELLDKNLNPDKDASYLQKMKSWFRDELKVVKDTADLLIKNAKEVSTDKLVLIESGIKEANKNFDPDSSSSYLGKLRGEVTGVQDKIQQMLDFTRTESFAHKMLKQMESYFGKDSPILKEVLGIVNTQQVIIEAELIKLREEIANKSGKAEMLEKTAIKGFLFEDAVEKILDSCARPFSDIVVRTSAETKTGKTGKKGDFTYEISSTDDRIVVEAKDESVGLKSMLAYMKEAMEYRECNFGILCTKNLEQLPVQVGGFGLYEGNKLFCNADFLPLALRWAKLYLERIKRSEDVEGYDVELVKDKISEIKNLLKNFTNIKTKLTGIDKSVLSSTEEIRELLERVKDGINNSLEEIENA